MCGCLLFISRLSSRPDAQCTYPLLRARKAPSFVLLPHPFARYVYNSPMHAQYLNNEQPFTIVHANSAYKPGVTHGILLDIKLTLSLVIDSHPISGGAGTGNIEISVHVALGRCCCCFRYK